MVTLIKGQNVGENLLYVAYLLLLRLPVGYKMG